MNGAGSAVPEPVPLTSQLWGNISYPAFRFNRQEKENSAMAGPERAEVFPEGPEEACRMG